MKCPKCGYVASDYLEQCKKCGADWGSVRARLGLQTPTVQVERTPESSPVRAEESRPDSLSELKARLDEEFDRLYRGLKEREQGIPLVRWGGFYRRALAFFIDLVVLLALSSALFYLTYVAYTVGLAAHGEMITWGHVGTFIRILSVAWIFLVGSYFVLLHGMGGKTVGKWLMGLRVVAANRNPISYGQAFARWLAYFPSSLFGVGFLLILLNREKRGMHDYLARTWVIRDFAGQSH